MGIGWGCYNQAGGWATRQEVNVEAIKAKTLVRLEPTKIFGREAMLWRVALVTMYRPKSGGSRGQDRGN